MSVVCIVQARMGSQRFPGKVLAMLGTKPVIGHVYERCRYAIPNTVVAIPASAENDPLADYLRTIDAPVFRWDGPENDVLGRYAACLKVHPADWVVRVTGDCPLVEPAVILGLVKRAQDTGEMYVGNVYPRTAPSGYDVEVIHAAELRWMHAALDPECPEREHVTSLHGTPFPHLSIDTPADLERVRALTADR